MAATTPSTSLHIAGRALGGGRRRSRSPRARRHQDHRALRRELPATRGPVNPARHAFHLRIARVCGDRVHGTWIRERNRRCRRSWQRDIGGASLSNPQRMPDITVDTWGQSGCCRGAAVPGLRHPR